jgi:phosphomannomutase
MKKARLSDFPVKFGTSGARGLVEDLTPHYCHTFTAAFLKILANGADELLIGHDLRPSSPGIAAACMEAAETCGVACRFAGAVPTPALALEAMRAGVPAIMITGSHIPANRNGLKAYRPEGEISKADEQAMLAVEVDQPRRISPLPLPPSDPAVLKRYAARYVWAFGANALEGLRIGVYEHSTVARDLLHEVLQALGAKTVGLGRSEDFLPVDTEAIRPEDRELARRWSAGGGLDAIASADGDADRPLLADERGEWLRGDILGLLAAKAIGARTVVTPITSNTAIEACGAFQKVVRTRIGSPYVIAGMEEEGCPSPVVGFEANGGFLQGNDVVLEGRRLAALPTRDALMPVITVLRMSAQRRMPLSALLDELPRRFTHSERLENVPPEKSRALLERLAADHEFAQNLMAPRAGDIVTIDQTDGFRAAFADGSIVHLRASGNAPELRCYAEGSNPAGSEALCRDFLSAGLAVLTADS